MRPSELLRRRSLERDLAALADGSLACERRRRVEHALTDSPELRARLLEQHQALRALRAVQGGRAPIALRAVLALQTPTALRGTRPRTLRPAVAGAISALALALAVLLIGRAGSGPTVAAAAPLGTRPPVAAVQEPRDGQVTLPRIRVAGLPFPYWEDGFGWRAVGLRRDRLDGRVVTTVFYERARELIGYSIVPGPPLALGSPAHRTVRAHTVLRSFSVDRRLIVTWQRRNHTCVLSGPRAAAGTMLRLAAWRAGGRLPF
jgi:hypothetical protein